VDLLHLLSYEGERGPGGYTYDQYAVRQAGRHERLAVVVGPWIVDVLPRGHVVIDEALVGSLCQSELCYAEAGTDRVERADRGVGDDRPRQMNSQPCPNLGRGEVAVAVVSDEMHKHLRGLPIYRELTGSVQAAFRADAEARRHDQ
jgi:hypothetical protein